MRDKRNYTLVLGDSTSMTVGYQNSNYIFNLANSEVWPENSFIINSSLHGFGSADALKFIKKYKKFNISLVIFNLGICDSISTETLKKKYKNNFFKIKDKKNKLFNKLSNFEWNNNYNFFLNRIEKIEDFKYNIETILNYFKKKKIQTCLIIPSSNYFFLPGMAKGNIIFYKFIDLHDKISNILKIEYPYLFEAFKKFEEKNFKESSEIFFKILTDKNKLNYDKEFFTMIANNYAVSSYNSGDLQEALSTLNYLEAEQNIRLEIIYYNIANIFKNKGDIKNYNLYMNKSYDYDSNNYRISTNISNYLFSIKDNFDFYIDVNNINQATFYDHCHLDKLSNIKLSKAILNKLEFNYNSKSKIINDLTNPEYTNNNEDFSLYFNIKSKTPINEVKSEINQFIDLYSGSDEKTQIENLPDILKFPVTGFFNHPLFTSISDINICKNLRNYFFGKFPEFYLFHYTEIIYNSLLTSVDETNITIDESIYLNKNDKIKILNNLNLKHDLQNMETTNIFQFININKLDKYIFKIKNNLLDNLSYKKLFFNRQKTLMYWYFRESLRYGTQSRFTMFFDFPQLQNIYESIIICYLLNKYFNSSHETELYHLKDIAENIYQFQKNFFCNYTTDKDFYNKFDYNFYYNEIEKFKKNII